MYHVGIDPGADGAAVLLDHDGNFICQELFKEATLHDVADTLAEWIDIAEGQIVAMLEQVGSMPKQGVSSSFKFGRSYGQLEGLLTGLRIAYKYVAPAKWKRAMGCIAPPNSTQTEKKRIDKAAAQRLWPAVRKITNSNADAMLIAKYSTEHFNEKER